MKEESPARWTAWAAAPAPALRRRENLRSASFRDYTTGGATPGRGDGSAVLSRWQGPRATTERGLNTGCRGHPCRAIQDSASALPNSLARSSGEGEGEGEGHLRRECLMRRMIASLLHPFPLPSSRAKPRDPCRNHYGLALRWYSAGALWHGRCRRHLHGDRLIAIPIHSGARRKSAGHRIVELRRIQIAEEA